MRLVEVRFWVCPKNKATVKEINEFADNNWSYYFLILLLIIIIIKSDFP